MEMVNTLVIGNSLVILWNKNCLYYTILWKWKCVPATIKKTGSQQLLHFIDEIGFIDVDVGCW